MTADLPKLPADLTARDRSVIDHTFIGLINAFDGPEMRDRSWNGAEIADMIRIMQSIARKE